MLQWLGLAGPQELLLYAAAVFILNATPGVDMLLTVTRTLQGGVRAGLAAAAGINAGCVVHVLAAAFGLAALLAVSTTLFAVIKWAGAAYLLWLAVGMWRQAWRGPTGSTQAGAEAAGCTPAAAQRSLAADFHAGVLTNLLNPKVALFFLAFLPQFIHAGTEHKTLAFIGLGLLGIAQGAVFLLAVVLVAARLRRLGSSPGLVRGLQVLGGAVFAALALRLASARSAG
ncbi:MAG: LysE family translocator [Rubrivivax sp.]|nr:LysE family translocator [Rubrivivax sp.]